MITRVTAVPRSKVGAWIQASRLPTLWAAVSPVAVGSGCAWNAGCFSVVPALACLFGALFIQLGTNYANDLFDFRKGADREDRLGPTRVVAAGWLSQREVAVGMAVAFMLSILCGVYLTAHSGWPVVVIGVASVASGLAYTGGPWPLAYLGLGDLFVMVFFGFVAVCGTVFMQCGQITTSAWLSSVAVGALGTAILAVNNLRDRQGDARAEKKTLVVRFGEDFGRAEVLSLLGLAYVVLVVLAIYGFLGALLALGSLPLAVLAGRKAALCDGAELNPVLGATARLQIVFSLLLAAGLIWI